MNEQTKKEIMDLYQKGHGSIQDYARIYNVPIHDVLALLKEEDLSTVHVGGDMIDASEAGPSAKMNYGEDVPVPYSLN